MYVDSSFLGIERPAPCKHSDAACILGPSMESGPARVPDLLSGEPGTTPSKGRNPPRPARTFSLTAFVKARLLKAPWPRYFMEPERMSLDGGSVDMRPIKEKLRRK